MFIRRKEKLARVKWNMFVVKDEEELDFDLNTIENGKMGNTITRAPRPEWVVWLICRYLCYDQILNSAEKREANLHTMCVFCVVIWTKWKCIQSSQPTWYTFNMRCVPHFVQSLICTQSANFEKNISRLRRWLIEWKSQFSSFWAYNFAAVKILHHQERDFPVCFLHSHVQTLISHCRYFVTVQKLQFSIDAN